MLYFYIGIFEEFIDQLTNVKDVGMNSYKTSIDSETIGSHFEKLFFFMVLLIPLYLNYILYSEYIYEGS